MPRNAQSAHLAHLVVFWEVFCHSEGGLPLPLLKLRMTQAMDPAQRTCQDEVASSRSRLATISCLCGFDMFATAQTRRLSGRAFSPWEGFREIVCVNLCVLFGHFLQFCAPVPRQTGFPPKLICMFLLLPAWCGAKTLVQM